MKLACFSDTHGYHKTLNLPKADGIVFAGDLCAMSTITEIVSFITWFSKLQYKYKIIVAGNHDIQIHSMLNWFLGLLTNTGIIYLQDSGINLKDKKIYGTPWSPIFMNWAFMLYSDELEYYYNKIPNGIDLLISHCPPYGILDTSYNVVKMDLEHYGSKELLSVVTKVSPKHHIFGHLHDGYGDIKINNTHYYNVSICNDSYNPIGKVTIIDI